MAIAYESEYHQYEEGELVKTPEAKKADVEDWIREYKPDTSMVFLDVDGGGEYKRVTASVQWDDIFKPHEYEDAIRYLSDLSKRTDVQQVSVIIVADF